MQLLRFTDTCHQEHPVRLRGQEGVLGCTSEPLPHIASQQEVALLGKWRSSSTGIVHWQAATSSRAAFQTCFSYRSISCQTRRGERQPCASQGESFDVESLPMAHLVGVIVLVAPTYCLSRSLPHTYSSSHTSPGRSPPASEQGKQVSQRVHFRALHYHLHCSCK